MLLKVMTWNLGSGMYDNNYYKGIKRDLYTKYNIVNNNIKGQINLIKENNCDILLLQEVAKFYINNSFINQYKILKNNLLDYNCYFSNNKFLLNLVVEGKATYTKLSSSSEDLYIPYKAYNIKDNISISNKHQIITRIKIKDKELVIFNIHLAPCKRLKDLRDKQLKFILDIANIEIEKGNYVIIGGDFNMNMSNVKLDLACYISDKPTNRDLENSYTNKSKMNKYEGFICSNNIKLNYIKAIDNFLYSDHCPVIAEFELKEN